MNSHKNAKLTARSREKMVRRMQHELAVKVTTGYGVRPRTARNGNAATFKCMRGGGITVIIPSSAHQHLLPSSEILTTYAPPKKFSHQNPVTSSFSLWPSTTESKPQTCSNPKYPPSNPPNQIRPYKSKNPKPERQYLLSFTGRPTRPAEGIWTH